MKQTLCLKNTDLNSTFDLSRTIQTTINSAVHLEIILERLSQQDDEIFTRIITAIKINNDIQSVMLASELARIRILKRNIRMILDLLQYFKTKHLY